MKNFKMLVYDIGAHQGEDTEYYLERGFNVIAFECMPENIRIIQERFHQELSTRQLILETRAVLSGGGKGNIAEFFVDENSVWGTLHRKWAERNLRLGSKNKVISVETMDPKQIFKDYGKPYFIKIDIEGEDINVLQALATLDISDRPRYVSIESSKTSWRSLISEFKVFEELGYKRYAVVAQSKMPGTTSKWISNNGNVKSYNHQMHSSGPFGEDLSKSCWISKKQAVQRYRLIFFWYWLFGDDGIFAPRKIKNTYLRRKFSRMLNRFRMKDWYDTHAKMY